MVHKWCKMRRGEKEKVGAKWCMYWDLFVNFRRRRCLINVIFGGLSGCHFDLGPLEGPFWKGEHHQCPMRWIWQGNPTIPTNKKKRKKIMRQFRIFERIISWFPATFFMLWNSLLLFLTLHQMLSFSLFLLQ